MNRIEKGAVKGYKAIETGVVNGYKKIETGFVNGFSKVTDYFVDSYLTNEDETVAQAKSRLANENKERMEKQKTNCIRK